MLGFVFSAYTEMKPCSSRADVALLANHRYCWLGLVLIAIQKLEQLVLSTFLDPQLNWASPNVRRSFHKDNNDLGISVILLF